MRHSNVVSIESAQPIMNLKPATQECVEQCKNTFSSILFQHFQTFLSHTDDAFFALADKSNNSDDQSLYFAAMRAVRKHRKLTETRFQSQWSASFTHFWQTGNVLHELTGAEENNGGLALQSMIAKGIHRYKDPLDELNQAFTRMSGAVIDDESNPFSPYLICQMYDYAIQEIRLDAQARLVLDGLFERDLVRVLDAAYRALLNRLSQFLTYNNNKISVKPQIETPKRESEPSYLDVVQHSSGTTHEVSDELKVNLSALLSYQGDTPKKPTSVKQSDNDVLNMVKVMFDFVLEDRNLPNPIKTLIARLQAPMVKVGLLDKHFLTKKEHPARCLLNELVQAGVKWNPQEGQGVNTLFGQMSTVVTRIVVEFDDDMSIFDESLHSFSSFLQQEGRYAQAAERRTAQVTQGKEHLGIAKLKAANEVEERLLAFYVPASVRELIEAGWQNVLLLVYLRQGHESEAWQNAIQVLDDVVWTCQPKLDPNARQKMLRMIPSLLKRLRAGLIDISYDSEEISKRLKDLQAYHISVLRGEFDVPMLQPNQVIAEGKKPDIENISKHGADVPQEKSATEDAYLVQAKALNVGAWLAYVNEHYEHVRCKLSWKSDVTGTYVFVNRRGAKVMEVTLNGLVSLLRRDDTNMLEDVSIIDRAMSSMLNTLKG